MMNLQFGILLQKKSYIVCIAEKYQIKIYCLQFAYQGSFTLSTFMISTFIILAQL